MTKKTLASIKAAFGDQEKNQGGTFQNNYYPFWNMKEGERCVIRFLPDLNEDNPRGFLVEKHTHRLTINGQVKTVPCLSMYGEQCPICKVSAEYYKAEGKESVNGKKYWKKKSYTGQILVVEDPLAESGSEESAEGKVKLISLGFQIYNIIKESIASDDLESLPYGIGGEDADPDEYGYDFVIKKTAQGNYATYAVGTKFQNRARALTDEELEEIEANSIDLSTTLPKNPTLEKVQALLNADLNGEDYEDGDESSDRDSDESEAPWENKKVQAAPAKKTVAAVDQPAKTAATKEAASEDGEARSQTVDDMLARIRAKRAKQQESSDE